MSRPLGFVFIIVHVCDLVRYVFISCTVLLPRSVRLTAGGPGVSSVLRGHDERLCWELEVDTEGQRKKRGGWWLGGWVGGC